MADFPLSEPEFSQFLVREYFKYGSVDEVLRRHLYALPISYASYQRVLSRYGVVKKAGPNNHLSEAIDFFEHLVKDNMEMESLYRTVPASFKTSLKTLYRIYSYMKEGLTRRVGVALVISPFNDRQQVLLANDVSLPSPEMGKNYGCLSLPMGYSRKRDSRRTGVIRILQQEVFTSLTVKGVFPFEIIPFDLEPFAYIEIADVRVAAYSLILPKNLSSPLSFSSFKLKGYRFWGVREILKGTLNSNIRAGVSEIIGNYAKYLKLADRNLSINPLQDKSFLNRSLAQLTLEIEK